MFIQHTLFSFNSNSDSTLTNAIFIQTVTFTQLQSKLFLFNENLANLFAISFKFSRIMQNIFINQQDCPGRVEGCEELQIIRLFSRGSTSHSCEDIIVLQKLMLDKSEVHWKGRSLKHCIA